LPCDHPPAHLAPTGILPCDHPPHPQQPLSPHPALPLPLFNFSRFFAYFNFSRYFSATFTPLEPPFLPTPFFTLPYTRALPFSHQEGPFHPFSLGEGHLCPFTAQEAIYTIYPHLPPFTPIYAIGGHGRPFMPIYPYTPICHGRPFMPIYPYTPICHREAQSFTTRTRRP
jgi:hypothetical protein